MWNNSADLFCPAHKHIHLNSQIHIWRTHAPEYPWLNLLTPHLWSCIACLDFNWRQFVSAAWHHLSHPPLSSMGQWDPADSSTPAPAQCLIAICLLPSWENMLDWSYFMLGLTLSLSVFYIVSLCLSLLVLLLSGLFWCFPCSRNTSCRESETETERSRRMRGFSAGIKASEWAFWYKSTILWSFKP